MKWAPIVLACLLTSAWGQGEPEPTAARPGWAQRYLQAPSARWDAWRNALKPRGEPAPPLTLATEGQTDYVIVIPAAPSAFETRAADELQLWLGQITGATYPIVPDSTEVRERELSVGRTARAEAAGLLQAEDAGGEGYAITVDKERVYLLGSGSTGPLYAALALLEEDLGVRWYTARGMEGENWDERIADMNRELNAARWSAGEPGDCRAPHSPTLRLGIVPRISSPAVPLRHFDFNLSSMPWGVRNRVNGGWAAQYGQHWYVHGGAFCHTFHWLVPPAKHFAEHPEYYSLVGGERRWEQAQLCLSNPEVAQVAAQTALEALRSAAGTRRMVSVSAMDWGGHCQCDECRALEQETGAWSGVLLQFVNRVAELVEEEIPDATITTLSYWDSNRPPTADVHARESVAIRFCLDWGASFTWPYHSFYDATLSAAPAHEGNKWTPQRQSYARWRELSPRMHLWMYPSQYRHTYAPMPNIRAVAENIRYFAEQQAESIFIQPGGSDMARRAMRNWVFSKLMWDPTLDPDELMQDFIWGTYGAAAPAVAEYHELLWDHCARYTDFSRERDWIHAIHDEGMYLHGFVEKAREVLDGALAAADNEALRKRVGLLKLGVVYVEALQLYIHMRDDAAPPDVKRYGAVVDELEALCEHLEIEGLGLYDGSRTIGKVAECLEEMRSVWERRLDRRFLQPEAWGEWTFCWDLEDRGVAEEWFGTEYRPEQPWTPVPVPAFLANTQAGNETGYGWYRTTFTLPAEHAGRAIELEFDGVDEQAWVYVNGQLAGEHTLRSEFMVGQEITVEDLWNRPFTLPVDPELLRAGENVLVVRIHNSAMNAGIHQPVRAYLPPRQFGDACDGAALDETFAGIEPGGIPEGWRRHVQERDGQVFGLAEVSRHFVRTPTLHLRDQRSHVVVWSASDEVLPPGDHWAVQFDFRLTGRLCYKAADCGALFGLKRGEPGSADFLPLVQVDNDETPGGPVRLLGLGQVLTEDLATDQWHRLVIHRRGTDWDVYLDDELKGSVAGRGTDYRGFALGSFQDWQHVAEDVHYANMKIGGSTGLPERE